MKILVINSGSSSIKYQMIEMPSEKVICAGMIDRIGLADSKFTFKSDQHDLSKIFHIENHQIGLEKIAGIVLDKEFGIIKTPMKLK